MKWVLILWLWSYGDPIQRTAVFGSYPTEEACQTMARSMKHLGTTATGFVLDAQCYELPMME